MAVKSIKLRGITRNPSDRMMEEGGVAESLNVYLDNTENRPMALPKTVSDTTLPRNKAYDVIYYHEGNYICKENRNIGVYNNNGILQNFFTLDNDEIVNSITSVGHTLVVNTNKQIRYVLYKDGTYTSLESYIPVPDIRFYGEKVSMLSENDYKTQQKQEGFNPLIVGKKNNNATNEKIRDTIGPRAYRTESGIVITPDGHGSYSTVTFDDTIFLKSYAEGQWSGSNNRPLDNTGEVMLSKIWEGVNSIRDFNHYFGILSSPVFMSFAVRLYDGSVYIPTEPIALGTYGTYSNSNPNGFSTKVTTYTSTTEDQSAGLVEGMKLFAVAVSELDYAYKAHILFGNIKQQYENWRDLVEGIDIYITNPVRFEKEYNKCRVSSANPVTAKYEGETQYEINLILDPDTVEGNLDESLVKDMVFHKIYSYKFDEFAQISNTDRRVDEDLRSDNLGVKESMTGDYSTNHRVLSSGSMTYNSRLTLYNVSRKTAKGYAYLNGAVKYEGNNYQYAEYRFIWELMSSDGNTMHIHGNDVQSSFNMTIGGQDTRYRLSAFSFISYPDSRCRSVIVGKRTSTTGIWSYKQIPMKEFTNLDCSYCFAGLGIDIFDHPSAVDLSADKVPSDYSDEYMRGYIWQSASNNPFLFPDEGKFKVADAEVIGVATVTTALSEGQFGAYGLYVFTDAGIWVLGINDEGGIISSVPLSRDVALSRESITPIDQAIVFMTDKGLKLIRGSDASDLSSFMLGPQWKLDNTAEESILDNKGMSDMKAAMKDGARFMRFMAEARCCYDYIGGRLVFIKEEDDSYNPSYQYVYKIESQSWHKVQMFDRDITVGHPINLYPRCLTNYQETRCISLTAGGFDPNEIDEQKVYEILTEYGYGAVNTTEFLRGNVSLDVSNLSNGVIDNLKEDLAHEDVLTEKGYRTESGVMDWSTPLEIQSDDEIKGVIVTRGIALDNDDVLKTITSVKIRGNYKRYDSSGKPRVSYILEGSQDGIKYHRLGSLRGKAWKMFRFTILFSLTNKESLSWIDVQYEPVFTDRLR